MNSNIQEIHTRSMQNLGKIQQLLAESNDMGALTLEQLSIDKEKLLKVRQNVDEVNTHVNIGRRILRKMNWEDDKKKIIVCSSAVLVAGAAITAGVLIKK